MRNFQSAVKNEMGEEDLGEYGIQSRLYFNELRMAWQIQSRYETSLNQSLVSLSKFILAVRQSKRNNSHR
jgi:hypothetical protein